MVSSSATPRSPLDATCWARRHDDRLHGGRAAARLRRLRGRQIRHAARGGRGGGGRRGDARRHAAAADGVARDAAARLRAEQRRAAGRRGGHGGAVRRDEGDHRKDDGADAGAAGAERDHPGAQRAARVLRAEPAGGAADAHPDEAGDGGGRRRAVTHARPSRHAAPTAGRLAPPHTHQDHDGAHLVGALPAADGWRAGADDGGGSPGEGGHCGRHPPAVPDRTVTLEAGPEGTAHDGHGESGWATSICKIAFHGIIIIWLVKYNLYDVRYIMICKKNTI